MERKAFTIVRSAWWRGHSAIGSKLLIRNTRPFDAENDTAKGKMCCLGSIALQCGATEDQIADVESPARLAMAGVSLDAFTPLLMTDRLGATNSKVCNDMMQANDSDNITDAEREAKLTTLAATIGWDLTFVD